MSLALNQARLACQAGEVPVGAVLVLPDYPLIVNRNRIIENHDPTAHAEILCIREASRVKQNERIGGVLFSTLEPCHMCAGAAVLARLDVVIFAAKDIKSGACGSVNQVCNLSALNHQIQLISGIMAEESSLLLKNFFRARRKLTNIS